MDFKYYTRLVARLLIVTSILATIVFVAAYYFGMITNVFESAVLFVAIVFAIATGGPFAPGRNAGLNMGNLRKLFPNASGNRYIGWGLILCILIFSFWIFVLGGILSLFGYPVHFS